MTSTEPGVYYDPYDAAIDADPHPVWKRMRDEEPLYYNERYDFYALSRYDDVLAASLDWHTYSSARGITIEMIDTSPPASWPEPSLDDAGMIIMLDPPEHDHKRKLVSRAFTPKRVAALEARTRELCRHFLDPHVGGVGFDYVEEFAAKIPTMVIGALLGVPAEDQDQLRIWIDLMMRYEPDGPTPEKQAATRQISRYIEDLVSDHEANPRDDMLSDLVRAEVVDDEGTTRKLAHSELVGFFQLLEFAGSETTARLLGWASVLLARFPEQRAALVAEPELIPNAVEELLRYEAPSPIQGRFVTREVEWHGRTLPAYSKIALLTGSAGRDERQFEDPDRFDVRRRFERHVSFGYGIHYCLGANLARLEARVALEETLRRFPEWAVDDASVEYAYTSTVRGPSHVPVTF